MTGRLRLLHLRDENEAFSDRLNASRPRFQAIAKAEPTRAVQSFNLFQTPEPLAERMAALLASLLPDRAVPWLEPSAGLGRLYRAGRAAGLSGSCLLVDVSSACCAELYRATAGDSGIRLRCADFLEVPTVQVGAVLMNPPFQRGTDVKHIVRAWDMLAPGGWLVGLCFDGTIQRKHLAHRVTTWETLPANTFKAEGTTAAAALITWRKPA